MRSLFRQMPRSLWWFVLTGAVYLLQVFPPTGLFLMFLVAPYWSIATVNLGFLSIILETVAGRINPYWLILPCAWFAGYTGAAYMSHRGVAALDADVRAINARQHVAFQPSTQALVFDVNSQDLSGAPEQLVREYSLPVAY